MGSCLYFCLNNRRHMKTDPTRRFTDRVENYVRYRPGYPTDVIDFLNERCGLTQKSVIADLGSGTGIFAKLLADQGYTVYGVEPNDEMRRAAERQLRDGTFISVCGTAEHTRLSPRLVDLVVSAQAFHWFNPETTRQECKRILKRDNDFVALIWNNRLTDSDAFARAYERLLADKATDYKDVNHQHLKGVHFASFFRDGEYSLTRFPNHQTLDFQGLTGRAFSSSYVPAQDSEAGSEFKLLLHELFNAHAVDNAVTIRYETEVYLGEV